ncbi:MAG: alpha-ketoglutarate-dependent dioxygenase AlkB [Methylococcaceae bacterium]|nr:alpha-ketoglutarate-dependent dioxygenase AlkB [Methylococcaceae bacterium]
MNTNHLQTSLTNLAPVEGELYLIDKFYSPPHADKLFNCLINDLAWQEEEICIYGRWVKVPRLMCWYGDEHASYEYSHVVHQPLPWTDDLQNIQEDIQPFSAYRFNSVLGNLYRDGNDSMGSHADDEPELGQNPVIASLSLGESRNLKLKHQQHKTVLDVPLEHGDLLIMAGTLQHHWQHSLPKTKRLKQARINLTFRTVFY